jgi:hypothetical protein
MGKRSQIQRQKWIVKLLSDGNVWANREIFEASLEKYKGGMKGFSSWIGCCSLLGQMARHTNTRISSTHEVIKVGEGRNFEGSKQKYVEYMLQER